MAPWDVSFLNSELGLICKAVLCWDIRLYSDILLQLGWLSRRQSQIWQPVCLRAPPSFPLRMHPLGGSRTLGVGSALQADKDARTFPWGTLQLCSVSEPPVLGPKGSPERCSGGENGNVFILVTIQTSRKLRCSAFYFFSKMNLIFLYASLFTGLKGKNTIYLISNLVPSIIHFSNYVW